MHVAEVMGLQLWGSSSGRCSDRERCSCIEHMRGHVMEALKDRRGRGAMFDHDGHSAAQQYGLNFKSSIV